VPLFRSSVAKQFLPDNPFLHYGRLQQFITLRNSKVVGRIVAIVNKQLIEREQRQVGLFGFFECIAELRLTKLYSTLLASGCANKA
jgi:hypothetical protein